MAIESINPACGDAAADYAVIGLGVSGRSALRFLLDCGASVIAMDTRLEPPSAAAVRAAYPTLEVLTGPLDAAVLSRCPRIIVSPGVAPDLPALRSAAAAGCEILGDVELFARHAAAPVIAITGTNGKSTVTTLVANVLEACGFVARRGGNLGTPALELLGTHEPDFYVLELSSFQLEVTTSLAPRVGCILNLAPDHIDRHGSFENYARIKARVLERAETAVLNADDADLWRLPFGGRRLGFSLGEPAEDVYGVRTDDGVAMLASLADDFLPRAELGLAGAHNVANVLAAIAICEVCGVEREAMIASIRQFRGLAHRAEVVAKRHGVTYINDSKATNPGAACASIAGLMASSGGVVIAGGEPKGVQFDALAEVAVTHAHSIVVIGRAAREIERAVAGRVPCTFARDMPAAVRTAAAAARTGEVVLLSPACASFDMFSDYAARGQAFREAVAALGDG